MNNTMDSLHRRERDGPRMNWNAEVSVALEHIGLENSKWMDCKCWKSGYERQQ